VGFDAVIKDNRHGVFQHGEGHGAKKQHDADTDDADVLEVTLRGKRMWEFFDRLVAVAIPRVRDFRGLNPNRSMGVATTRSE